MERYWREMWKWLLEQHYGNEWSKGIDWRSFIDFDDGWCGIDGISWICRYDDDGDLNSSNILFYYGHLFSLLTYSLSLKLLYPYFQTHLYLISNLHHTHLLPSLLSSLYPKFIFPDFSFHNYRTPNTYLPFGISSFFFFVKLLVLSETVYFSLSLSLSPFRALYSLPPLSFDLRTDL